MKYTVLGCIKTDNNSIRNAAQRVLSNIDEDRIIVHANVDTVDPDDGITTLIINVSFHVEADMNNALKSIKALGGIIQGCEFGSYIKTIKSYHDETPPRKCEIMISIRRT